MVSQLFWPKMLNWKKLTWVKVPSGCETVCKALSGISTLTKLFLIDNNISDKVTTVLSQKMQIKGLNLSRNNLQSMGCVVICKALEKVSTLSKLYFRSNNISGKAAKDIAAVSYQNTQLQELDLSGNNLQVKGCMLICKALQKLSTLSKLAIS